MWYDGVVFKVRIGTSFNYDCFIDNNDFRFREKEKLIMAYVPSPDPIRNPDMTDREWYEYRLERLIEEREALDQSLPGWVKLLF